MATKILWRLIQFPEKLWSGVILAKYCLDSSIVEWLRNPNKTYKNGSIGWKDMVLDYPLIKQWIGWKIGDGNCVRVGEDPWMGLGENFKLSPRLIQILRSTRIFTVADACRDPIIRGCN